MFHDYANVFFNKTFFFLGGGGVKTLLNIFLRIDYCDAGPFCGALF